MAMDTDRISELVTRLESLGELKVRELLVTGEWGVLTSDTRTHVEDWLRSKESIRGQETMAIARGANAIAHFADSTANEALRTARQQKTVATIAAIAAVIAAIAAIINILITWSSKS
jgi:hypothetical protein